ncbi:MAG: T9SS type A sorting domain-containing protein, partial [Bacteroidetes bacterium]|nr:T9SS type A sorting domain-containing protein [Bacteroidota bacterium]
PVAINGTRCGIGPVTIGATATDTIKWFANLTGGTPLNTGATYTPTVSATTTFYAQNTFTSCGGLSTPSTPTCYPTYSYACSSNDFINNFSTTLGTTNISNLSSGCNGNAPSNTLFYPNQIVTCAPGASFNLAIQAGTTWSQGFRIWIDYNNDGDFADVGEAVWASATSNILVNTGTITVPANIAPGPKRMRVMCRFVSVPLINDHCNPLLSFGEVEEYTLSVCTECASVRTPVIATVTPPPSINAVFANASLCGNDTTLISVASSNSTYNYVWSPATFLNITLGDSVLFMPTTPGNYTYYVDATDPVSGCATRDTVSALMSSIPTVTASVNLTPICAGTSINLTAAQPSATTQITNGNIVNTQTSYPAPYGQFYGGSRHQMLILASELITAGLSAGNLSGLTFQVTNTNASAPLSNFTISLAATSLTTMSTGFAAIPFTTVFTSPSYAPTTLTNTHLFSTPFYWNGTSNIIVQTCFANYTTPPFTTFTYNCSMRQTATPFVSTAYNYYDNIANICALASTYTIAQRPNIAFLSSFASWTYAWTPSLNITNPNQQNTSAAPQTSTNFIVTVTDTTSGCNSDDTVAVVVNPNPMPMLGADTTICSNTSLVLNASAGAYNYLWSNAATSQTIPVTTPGNYNVLVTDIITGCFASDSILIAVNAAPTFSLGADMVVCSGNTATFTGPSGQYNYNWNTLATTQSLITGINGSYVLTVTDSLNACFSSDTVALTVNALPTVALGNDTTICSNASLVLNASAGAYNYLWSNAATSQTIPVTTSGNYNVLVTDSITGCFASDSIVIAVNAAPSFSLGADMLVCSGNTVTFTGPTGQYNYNWNTLATTQTITTGINGSYVLTVTDLQTACFSSDTVALTVNALPIVALGNDITICSGNLPTTLVGPSNANFSYLWSNSTTNDSLSVSSSGNYYLLVTDNTTTCFNSDSILVSVNASPTVYLGNDTMLCGVSLTLNAGNIGASYAWSTSATSQTINVSTTGPYSVLVTDVNGCSDADTMNVTINPLPTVTATASSNVVCVDDAVIALTGTPTGGVWSGPGVTGSSLSPTAAGLGTHTAIYSYSDLNGCAGTAPVIVQVNACVNVIESILANGFNVYPNPTNGTFTLTIKDADFLELSIQITSIDGKLIASDRTSNVSGDYTSRFDLATHANGIYFLKVSGNGQTFVQKIVKQD